MFKITKEFKEFALKGNVLDMAIGVILGVAFGKIVTSLVNDILMPPLGVLLGRVDFSNLFLNLTGHYNTLAEAKAAGAATLNYGMFINTVIDFLIIAFVTFFVMRQFNKLKGPPILPETKTCPYCISIIAKSAQRCAYCTSELEK